MRSSVALVLAANHPSGVISQRKSALLIKRLVLRDHPILGDLELDFADSAGAPFPSIVLAGGNGCGKTVLLEAIHSIFEWEPRLSPHAA